MNSGNIPVCRRETLIPVLSSTAHTELRTHNHRCLRASRCMWFSCLTSLLHLGDTLAGHCALWFFSSGARHCDPVSDPGHCDGPALSPISSLKTRLPRGYLSETAEQTVDVCLHAGVYLCAATQTLDYLSIQIPEQTRHMVISETQSL